jgi:hypothetical protein
MTTPKWTIHYSPVWVAINRRPHLQRLVELHSAQHLFSMGSDAKITHQRALPTLASPNRFAALNDNDSSNNQGMLDPMEDPVTARRPETVDNSEFYAPAPTFKFRLSMPLNLKNNLQRWLNTC